MTDLTGLTEGVEEAEGGTAAVGLAARIRLATASAHRQAEGVPFVQDLVAGRLPVGAYARLVVQHRAIYRALEDASWANRDPDVAPFLAPELARLPALEEDLAFLSGVGGPLDLHVLEATSTYCDHMRAEVAAWPGALLAHHYVRYLGDLSGGQVIGRVLARVYGFPEGRGTTFYRFDLVPSPKAHKVRYRERLDALPWAEVDRRRLIDEIGQAYRSNAEVLMALGGAGEPGPRT